MKTKKKQIKEIREVLVIVIRELRKQGIVSQPFLEQMLEKLRK